MKFLMKKLGYYLLRRAGEGVISAQVAMEYNQRPLLLVSFEDSYKLHGESFFVPIEHCVNPLPLAGEIGAIGRKRVIQVNHNTLDFGPDLTRQLKDFFS